MVVARKMPQLVENRRDIRRFARPHGKDKRRVIVGNVGRKVALHLVLAEGKIIEIVPQHVLHRLVQ
ncbi:hypothetical protein SDC9_204412 [bioreactor metagenome]|uniref:Uncharacterized protein n=1 Tax=bioreactor metagenome TaxID=1076179 RepID=A0A645J0N9_9ZZZZ